MDIHVDATQSSMDMPKLHINGRNTTGIIARCPPPTPKTFIIAGWPHTKDELQTNIRPYWPYIDELVVIDGVLLKGRHINIPNSLQQQVLTQLDINHMGIEKMTLLACKSVFWHNINSDIEAYIKLFAPCLEFQQTQPREKNTHYDIPLRPWEVIGADVFSF